MPVYATGLGTVQASFTIAIHSQVDGIMQEVLFTEGQHVKKGDVLAKIDPRLFQAALDQAIAKKAQDQAQISNAQLNLQRDENLVTHQYATQQTVDNEKAQVAQLQATIQGDDAAIENARVQLQYATIRAPISGRTGALMVTAGNLVRANDQTPLVTINQVTPVYVSFAFPEAMLADLRPNRPCRCGPVSL